MKDGLTLISEERKEQIEKHERYVQDDVKYNANYELSLAASILCTPEQPERYRPPNKWGGVIWAKMVSKPYKERLVIAGALIAAELDRLNEIEQ